MATPRAPRAPRPAPGTALDVDALFAALPHYGLALHSLDVDGRGRVVDVRYRRVNAAFEAFTGLKAAEVTGRTVETVFDQLAPLKAAMLDRFARVARTGAPERMELFHERMRRWCSVSFFRVDARQVMASFEDITGLKNAQEDIRLFFEVALEFLCTAGFDGYFKRLNPRWSQVLGWTDEELKSKPFLEFVHPEDREATLQAAAALSQGKDIVNFVNRYACKDGSWRWISWNSFGAVDRGLIIAAARDVTDQKRLEQEVADHRQHLERLVEDRTQELTRAQQLVTRQAREILDLSTPILMIREGVVAAPLIGSLDSHRAEQFTERLLQAIVDTRSTVAIVDITGVPAIDTQCARYLLEATAAVRLLGARVVMTGIRPAIAQTLVHLGVDLSSITTCSSLLAGLKAAEDLRRGEDARAGR